MSLQSRPSTLLQIPDDGPDGNNRDATMATLRIMRDVVKAYKKDPRVRLFAGERVNGVSGKNWRGEIKAVFDWVKSNIRYTQDISGVETVQTPDATIELGYGDCDDMSVLLCSLLEAIGHTTRFCAAGFDPSNRNFFEHVWCQVHCPGQGRGGADWLSLDATENRAMGWEPDDISTWILVYN